MNLLEALENDLELENELKKAGITGDTFNDTMEAEGVFADKLERCIKVLNKWQSHINAKKAEIERLHSGIKSDEKNYERLKNWVTYVLTSRDIKKAVTPLYTVSLRTSESVEITTSDIEGLEPNFVRVITKLEPNKALIKEALKSGVVVAGAKLVKKQNLNFK